MKYTNTNINIGETRKIEGLYRITLLSVPFTLNPNLLLKIVYKFKGKKKKSKPQGRNFVQSNKIFHCFSVLTYTGVLLNFSLSCYSEMN